MDGAKGTMGPAEQGRSNQRILSVTGAVDRNRLYELRPLLGRDTSAGTGQDYPIDSGSPNAWALRLLQAADRHQTNPVRRQRVWLRLSHVPGRRGLPVRRMVMAMGIILGGVGGTAIASAALGHWPGWAARAYERLVPWSVAPTPSTVSVRAPSPGRLHRGARHSEASGEPLNQEVARDLDGSDTSPTAPVAAVPPVAVAVTSGSSPRSTASTASDNSRENTQRRESRESRESVGAARGPRHLSQMMTSEDDRPVLAAMRALRRDKNPVRARALLRRYLADHPNGTLAEEALAMSIEAAVAHGDPDATVLAGRYLQIYPSGPFRSLAQQTLNARP